MVTCTGTRTYPWSGEYAFVIASDIIRPKSREVYVVTYSAVESHLIINIGERERQEGVGLPSNASYHKTCFLALYNRNIA